MGETEGIVDERGRDGIYLREREHNTAEKNLGEE